LTVDPQQLESFESIIKQYSGNREELLNQMKEKLSEPDNPKVAPALESLKNQKSNVLERAKKIEISDGHIPFLPVIPAPYFGGYDNLMNLLEDRGGNLISDIKITNEVKVPDSPYYIFDVDNGYNWDQRSWKERKKRSELTAAELISLVALHIDDLEGFNWWAGGSSAAWSPAQSSSPCIEKKNGSLTLRTRASSVKDIPSCLCRMEPR
jgi:hypothetical protein